VVAVDDDFAPLVMGYSFFVVLRAQEDEEENRRCSPANVLADAFFASLSFSAHSAVSSFVPFFNNLSIASTSRNSLQKSATSD
jgi:hypothetical protein